MSDRRDSVIADVRRQLRELYENRAYEAAALRIRPVWVSCAE